MRSVDRNQARHSLTHILARDFPTTLTGHTMARRHGKKKIDCALPQSIDFFGPSWSQSDLLVAAAADSPLPSDHWTSEHAYQMGSASLPLLPKAQEVGESNATKIRVYKLKTTTNKIYNLNEHMQSSCRCI